jgi:hypothetical protein
MRKLHLVFLQVIVITTLMSAFEGAVSAIEPTPSSGEPPILQEGSPYDPFVAPKTNIELMSEVLLFEVYQRIEKVVITKFGKVKSESFGVAGIRKDGHGGYCVKVNGYVEHGSVFDYVDIYLGSPHFNSGLQVERIVVTHSEKSVIS